jgi:predicted nuclease of predicted toxin-antitoxin system
VNVKLLLDENLSPRVAEILRNEDGLDAVHIRDRGLLEATDPEVLERAYAEDRVLATKNVDDFVKLARARELHPGIILLEDGDLVRDAQLRVLRLAVAALPALRRSVPRAARKRAAARGSSRGEAQRSEAPPSNVMVARVGFEPTTFGL